MLEPSTILGREKLVDQLTELALAGRTALVHGPVGIGKTALLLSVRERIGGSGRPVAFSRRTEHVGDVTRALSDAYPAVDHSVHQRALRSRLQQEIEARPGVLLLDDLRHAGGALKSFLRSLEGTGLGILITADAEDERDHVRLRRMRLAYREFAVPVMPPRFMRLVLERELERTKPPSPVPQEDQQALLQIAAGRPGMLRLLVSSLQDERSWRDGRVRVETLRSVAAMAVARSYLIVPE